MRYDSVIVGAGPSGSTAARELAARGGRVLLLDRARFPRDKPCGGGVVVSAAALLPFDLAPVTERTVTGFRVTYRRGSSFQRAFDRPLVYMTQRRHLDAWLVEHAITAGATFQDDRRVTTIDFENGGVCVRFPGGDSVEAVTLIGADGANGVVRTALGLPRLRTAVALEANVSGVPALWKERLGLDLGSIAGGYGWVFPKGDHCNLGVGGWPVTGPALRRDLDAYAASEGFDPVSLHSLRGHLLTLRDPNSVLAVGCVVMVGDAAGLIDPLSGEGIGNAIRSGSFAAAEIGRFLDGDVAHLDGYAQTIHREIEPELAVSRQVQAILHQRPWPYVQLLHRYGRVWQVLCRVVRGEQTYASMRSNFGPAARLFDAAAAYATRGLMRRSGWA